MPTITQEETATTTVEPAGPLVALKIESLENLPENMIPLSIHPANPSIIYCMGYVDSLEDNRVLIGRYYRKVEVLELNIDDGTQKKLISEANFITLAKWSANGKYLGMVAGETLLLYNFEKGEIDNVNQLVNTPSVIYFGWSPDSKTIYTEHANLPNDSIYDVENKIGTPSYQVTERKPYFKDSYRDGLYMGTAEIADTWGNRKPVTVTLDEKGNVVQMIGLWHYL